MQFWACLLITREKQRFHGEPLDGQTERRVFDDKTRAVATLLAESRNRGG